MKYVQAVKVEFENKLTVIEDKMITRLDILEEKAKDVINNTVQEKIITSYEIMEAKLDNLERLNALNELVVSGIPALPNEDLYSIMKMIGLAIGFGKTDNIVAVYSRRIGTNSSGSPKHSKVFVKFFSENVKQEFL